MSEVKNFEMNARRALNAKQPKKESTVKSVVESMFGPLGKSEKPTPKPEAEVVDIRTKEKVKSRVRTEAVNVGEEENNHGQNANHI